MSELSSSSPREWMCGGGIWERNADIHPPKIPPIQRLSNQSRIEPMFATIKEKTNSRPYLHGEKKAAQEDDDMGV